MTRTLYLVIYSLLILGLTYVQNEKDIPFDYPSYPYHPYDILHAEINLDLDNSQHLVRGEVTYQIKSKIDKLHELPIHANELSIDQISVNNEELGFRINDDYVFIQLRDTLEEREEVALTIKWQSASHFGLHQSKDGSFWSSLNPLSHRHWLPGFDHPREAFTFECSIDIPNEMEVLFNGDLGEISPASKHKKRVRWSSETEVPATGLGFVSGNFSISEMTAGLTKIRLFHDISDQKIAADLIVEAARLKKEIEQVLSFENPWDALNMVLLPDNFWMERTHGSGTIYLFDRLGNLKNQLMRGMYAQWFGEYQRFEQYLNFNNVGEHSLLSTSLHFQLMDSKVFIDNPDSLVLIDSWNTWQENYLYEPIQFRSSVDNSLDELVREFKGVVGFEDYSEVWYEQTGVPYFDVNPYESEKYKNQPMEPSLYEVKLKVNEATSELSFYFDLVKGTGKTLSSLTLFEHQFDVVTSQEIIFTGNKDSVTVSMPRSTEFFTLESETIALENISFNEIPVYFLLNQLRSENPVDRISAAKSLLQHSNNPDLQLALSDILSFEDDEIIIAALYEALAAVMKGASGTEQQFINQINHLSEPIQRSAIKALSFYPKSDHAKSTLYSKVLTSEGSIFEVSVETYNKMASKSEMEHVLRKIFEVDTVGTKIQKIIEISESLRSNMYTLEIMDEFLMGGNEYEFREKALNHLYSFDKDFERWKSRLDVLLTDKDPRIRYWLIDKIPSFYSKDESLTFLSTMYTNEYDPRILLKIKEVNNQLLN